MVHNIVSYVFIDIETTGLPWQERNQTKITELSLVAVSRSDIQRSTPDSIIPMSKLSLNFNPQRNISPIVTNLTGLSNDILKYSTTFSKKIKSILSFLDDIPKPICLIAHNGYRFDYKILLAEFEDANAFLPADLLCADSLSAFQKLLKQAGENCTLSKDVLDSSVNSNTTLIDEDLLTDDEDTWPDLNVSNEEWQEIDDICSSLSNSHISSSTPIKQKTGIAKEKSRKKAPRRVNCTLTGIYEQLLKKKAINAHRAECDCLMLLECVIARKDEFLQWVDDNCKHLSEITPLKRY